MTGVVRHFPAALECDHGRNMDRIICDCATVNLGWHPTIMEAKRSWVSHVFDCLEGLVPLTPDEAEKVRATIKWLDGSYPASSEPDTVEALALLGGDQDGKRCPVCYSDICPATLQPGKDGGWVCTHGCGYYQPGAEDGEEQ